AGGKERKFDTLVDAVQAASDGDTIEIRGNGPFITPPINIQRTALTIRAGAGFSPGVSAHPEKQGDVLLRSQSLLVLEGLDLQWVNGKPSGPIRCLVYSIGSAARLYAVNCRFLMSRRELPHNVGCAISWDSALCHLRNCQMVVGGQG